MFKKELEMKFLLFLILLAPHTSFAKCDDLLSVLSTNYQNRVFVENYFYDGVYAVFEPSLNEEKSVISIFECRGDKHKKITSFSFKVKNIDGLGYSDEHKKLFVYFKFETEQYGWIEKKGDRYEFELFNDPEL